MVFKLVAFDAWHVTMIWTPDGVLKTLAIVFQSNLLVQILETTVDALKLTLATAVTCVYFKLTSQYTRALYWANWLFQSIGDSEANSPNRQIKSLAKVSHYMVYDCSSS